jgi:uncharacterized protein YwqG
VGGRPDLPTSLTWPTYNDVAMTFSCQINLTPIHVDGSPPRRKKDFEAHNFDDALVLFQDA